VKKRLAIILPSAALLIGVVQPARATQAPAAPTTSHVAAAPICLGNVAVKVGVCVPWPF
jgi:hypothetical protein